MTVLLFAYASLVDPASLARTLGRPVPPGDGPLPATLTGRRREWNVGSDRVSHPERILLLPDGSPFTGTLAVLGLREDAGAWVNGALYPVGPSDLDALATRERNYLLLDVTASVSVTASSTARDVTATAAVERVVAFDPRPVAVERLDRARAAGVAVVRRGYALGVEAAFARLGPGQLEAFRRTTAPSGLPVADVMWR